MSGTPDILGGEALLSVNLPGIPRLRSGKVREVFDLGDRLLFVATDRISAFDCIMPNGIPLKGKVLNQLSAWWFSRIGQITPHHVLETNVDRFPEQLQPYRDLLRGRSMIVRKTEVIPVECVARGYLIGSGWKEYQTSQSASGVPLRAGYQQADRLDEPIFTPARKADTGHDENISFAQVEQMLGPARAAVLRALTLEIYSFAAKHATTCGLILADTKFEFGMLDGKIVLIDEILTPDSSRFWAADRYQPGGSPPSYDKQYVRDYLETLTWDKTPPAPALPQEVVARTQANYLAAFRKITGADLAM